MKYLTATVAAIALVAIAAGCGGGGGSSTSASGPGGSTNASGSGDAATAAANEACAEANKTIAGLPAPDTSETVEGSVLQYLESTEQAVEQLQVEVAGLNGSKGITEYAEALAKSVTLLNEMANAARSGNPDGVRETSKELQKLQVGKVAEGAGLDTCAEAPGVEA